jgi:hypothetical protein
MTINKKNENSIFYLEGNLILQIIEEKSSFYFPQQFCFVHPATLETECFFLFCEKPKRNVACSPKHIVTLLASVKPTQNLLTVEASVHHLARGI